MRLTNVTRALEVPTTGKVRTENFFSLSVEKSCFATREYSCGLRIQPFLPAPRRLERFASVLSGEERASEASKQAVREHASERGREGPKKSFLFPPPAFASPLARLSRVHFSWYHPNGELARRRRRARRNPVFSFTRAYKHRLQF